MKKAAIYARVSTDKQAEKELSIPAQIKELKEYAVNNDMEIVKIYKDEGVSAKTDDRPEFQKMIAEAKLKSKPFDVILYHKNDRFARNREDAIVYKSLLRRDCGIELIAIKEDFGEGPVAKMIEGILEVIAEFYSLNLAQEVLKGMKEKSKKGLALGEPPYGYSIDENTNKYKVYEPEAKVVRYIFDEYINGGSLRTISIDLKNNGKKMFGKSAVEKVSKAIINKGKHNSTKLGWGANAISRCLRNKSYIGEYEWNDKIISNNHSPIIKKDKFKLANIMLNKKSTTKGNSKDYLLKGLVFCYECEGSLSQFNRNYKLKSTGEKKIYTFLRCSNHVRLGNCYANMQKMENVEDELIKLIDIVVNNPERMKISFGDSKNMQRIKTLENKLKKFDYQFDRQMKAYQSGVIELEQLKKYQQGTKIEKDKLIKEINRINRLDNDYKERLKDLQNRAGKTSNILKDKNASLQEKKNSLLTIVNKVYVSKKEDSLIIGWI